MRSIESDAGDASFGISELDDGAGSIGLNFQSVNVDPSIENEAAVVDLDCQSTVPRVGDYEVM